MLQKNRMLISERNQQLETPLHFAIRMQRNKIFKILLEYGADIHTKDLMGNSCYEIIKRSEKYDWQVIIEKYS